MINRSYTVYYTIPPDILEKDTKKRREAKGTISMNVVVPPEFEKKASKFMDSFAKEYEKQFKKFMKREIERKLEPEEDDGLRLWRVK